MLIYFLLFAMHIHVVVAIKYREHILTSYVLVPTIVDHMWYIYRNLREILSSHYVQLLQFMDIFTRVM